jgi:phage terminase large subunit
MTSKRQIIHELAKRQKHREAEALKPKFVISDFCFDKQIRFINDEAKFKTAVCSRRAGKTVSCAADLVHTCITNPGVNCAYITITRGTAKRIIWKDLISIIKKYDLKVHIDKQDLTFTFDNGSMLYISGADDEGEVEKYRGMRFKKVYIDEVQSFRSYIAELVNDVIIPALYDLDGSLILIGTPGPVPAGFFYDITQNKEWSHHHWTVYDNPFVGTGKRTVQQIIEEANKVRGIDEQHPTHLRENMGLWVKDDSALVFQISSDRNLYTELPNPDKMTYIMGVDIGWTDSDAIAILGYDDINKNVYLVEEYVKSKQTISQLVAEITYLRDKYKPVRMVMDAGALGKKIQEEIRQRHGIHMEAAEKHRKLEFIELLNDDLRTGKIKVSKHSRFYEDCFKVQWDRSNPHKPRISDIFHTDIGDSVLYSWRECRHYLSEKPPEALKAGTTEWMNRLEEEMGEKMEAAKRKSGMDDIVASQEDMDSLEADLDDLYND